MLNAVGFYALAPEHGLRGLGGPDAHEPDQAHLRHPAADGLPHRGAARGPADGRGELCSRRRSHAGWGGHSPTRSPVGEVLRGQAAAGQCTTAPTAPAGTTCTTYDGQRERLPQGLRPRASRPRACTLQLLARRATSGWKTHRADRHASPAPAGDGATRMIYFSQDGGAHLGLHRSTPARTSPSAREGAHQHQVLRHDSLGHRGRSTQPATSTSTPSRRRTTRQPPQRVTGQLPATITLTPTDATSGMTAVGQDPVQGRRRSDLHDRHHRGALHARRAHRRLPLHRQRRQRGEPDKTFTVTVRRQARPPAQRPTRASQPTRPAAG